MREKPSLALLLKAGLVNKRDWNVLLLCLLASFTAVFGFSRASGTWPSVPDRARESAFALAEGLEELALEADCLTSSGMVWGQSPAEVFNGIGLRSDFILKSFLEQGDAESDAGKALAGAAQAMGALCEARAACQEEMTEENEQAFIESVAAFNEAAGKAGEAFREAFPEEDGFAVPEVAVPDFDAATRNAKDGEEIAARLAQEFSSGAAEAEQQRAAQEQALAAEEAARQQEEAEMAAQAEAARNQAQEQAVQSEAPQPQTAPAASQPSSSQASAAHARAETPSEAPQPARSGRVVQGPFVFNTSTKKIHKESCGEISRMSEENKEFHSDASIGFDSNPYSEQGYTACKKCIG